MAEADDVDDFGHDLGLGLGSEAPGTDRFLRDIDRSAIVGGAIAGFRPERPAPRDPAAHRARRIGRQPPLFDLARSEEHTSELQSLMRTSYAVFCLKKKQQRHTTNTRQKLYL